MTFTETLAVAGRELDAVIADDLARLERRVRHDLAVTARSDNPPDWIEQNVAAMLRLQRRRRRTWRARVLVPLAFERYTPATPPC